MTRRIPSSPENGQPELPETVPACHDMILELLRSQNQLMQRLSVLEEKANLNSRNSSKPPSSDGPGTPSPRPRPKSGKRAAGQSGHKGSQHKACSRTANTCANLLKTWPALWTFVDNLLVSPTNNAAERALRDYVIKRKLSCFTRSGRGLRFTEQIFSTVQTCKMQGRVAFEYIGDAVQSWLAGIRVPSLVPEHIHLRHACG